MEIGWVDEGMCYSSTELAFLLQKTGLDPGVTQIRSPGRAWPPHPSLICTQWARLMDHTEIGWLDEGMCDMIIQRSFHHNTF